MKKLFCLITLMSLLLTASIVYAELIPASTTPASIQAFNSQLKRGEELYIPYFYNSHKPTTVFNDWIFNDQTGSPSNWFNEKNWLILTNITDKEATVYLFIYNTNGLLLNTANYVNGIPVNIKAHNSYGILTKDLAVNGQISWNGTAPLEGSIKILVPKKLDKIEDGQIVGTNIDNGTVSGNLTNLIFYGNTPSSFLYNQNISTFVLPIQQDPTDCLTSWPATVYTSHDCDSKIDSPNETLHFVTLCNTSDQPIKIIALYYSYTSSDPTVLGHSDVFQNIPAHGSICYVPTTTGFGLDYLLNNTSTVSFMVYVKAEDLQGNPIKAALGQLIQVRSQTTTFDTITDNLYKFFQD